MCNRLILEQSQKEAGGLEHITEIYSDFMYHQSDFLAVSISYRRPAHYNKHYYEH